jgi:thiol:disulfide interchange protein DsbA
MMNKIQKLLAALLLLLAAQSPAWADEPGYTVLRSAQPTHSGNKIEVLEFFFYGCSHCYNLRPNLLAWEKKKPKDVAMDFVPTIFADQWEPMANTYYALDAMGKHRALDDALYDAWHQEIILTDADQIADFVSQHGVDRQKFAAQYNSFTVQAQVARSKQMMLAYNIRGTPTLVVDGKYVVTGLLPDDMIRALDMAVSRARKDRAGGKH